MRLPRRLAIFVFAIQGVGCTAPLILAEPVEAEILAEPDETNVPLFPQPKVDAAIEPPSEDDDEEFAEPHWDIGDPDDGGSAEAGDAALGGGDAG